MRYSEDKIKEAILHPDLDVRDTAIHYFYHSTAPDDTLMPLAIQAIERYGRTKAFSFTHYLNLLPQTEQTIGWVIAEFPRASRDFRLWASDLLCKIHLATTVQRVLELLPGETDLVVRLNLCEALLDHFSDEGIEPARLLIKEHELKPDLRRLRSSLIAVCKVMASRFPEFDVWQEETKSDAQQERAKTQEIQKMAFEAGGDMGLLVRKLKAQIAEQQVERKRPGAIAFLRPGLWDRIAEYLPSVDETSWSSRHERCDTHPQPPT